MMRGSAQRVFRFVPIVMTYLVAPTLLATFVQQVLLVGGDAKSQVIDSLSLVFLLELDNIVFKFIGPERQGEWLVGSILPRLLTTSDELPCIL